MPSAPTPHSRLVALLSTALPQLDPSHEAYTSIKEAHAIASGLEPYLSSISSSLIVPSSYSIAEEEVRTAWEDLLKATDEEDWNARFENGETRWRLNSGMCSGDFEATVLQNLALSTKAKRILEIGVFTGTVTLALGLLPEVTSIVALDIEQIVETFDRPFWERAGVSEKIKTKIGPAAESLKSLSSEKAEPFDLVFIDADKPGYETYVKTIMDLDLLALGGVILADNTLYKALPWTEWDRPKEEVERNKGSNNQSVNEATKGIVDFNNFVKKDRRLIVSVLPIRDGISVIQRRP